ncbi:MAG: dockerin type I domain-containing protein, partial [Planctomycetota bacterium]|nr:dockerin type I domain-containing protein [Planctomycetota bacterium]
QVNLTDVKKVALHSLGDTLDGLALNAADYNGDNGVNVLDLVAIVNFIEEENLPVIMLGDTNGDGGINVMDITTILYKMSIGEDPGPAADWNQDGGVNVLDIVGIVNHIMNQ